MFKAFYWKVRFRLAFGIWPNYTHREEQINNVVFPSIVAIVASQKNKKKTKIQTEKRRQDRYHRLLVILDKNLMLEGCASLWIFDHTTGATIAPMYYGWHRDWSGPYHHKIRMVDREQLASIMQRLLPDQTFTLDNLSFPQDYQLGDDGELGENRHVATGHVDL